MATSDLQIVTVIEGSNKTITMKILPGSFLPTAIFMYQHTNEGLGDFYGVCSKAELQRLRQWNPEAPLPTFGNRYVRHIEAVTIMAVDQDADQYLATVTQAVKDLSISLQTTPSVTKIVKIT